MGPENTAISNDVEDITTFPTLETLKHVSNSEIINIQSTTPSSLTLNSTSTRDLFSDTESVTSTTSTSSSRLKKYFCDYDGCDKSFTRPSLLTHHQQTAHQGLRPFLCNQCDKNFTRKSHLERHLISHLNDRDKPFHCSVCSKGCATRQQLKRHEVTHTKSFKCPYEGCIEAFYKHPQLRSHILSFHLNQLKCSICGKSFQRPYRLRHHMEKHHNPDNLNPYSCNFSSCSQSFKTWTALQCHIKNDHPKLKCPICNRHLVGEDGLKMHMKIHDDSIIMRKNWSCPLCKIDFIKKVDLIEHYRSEHSDIPFSFTNKEPETDEIGQNKRPVHKSIPDLDYEPNNIQNQINLENYLKQKNNSGIKLLLNTVGRKFKCTFQGCQRTFKTQEKFDIHINKHKIHQLKLLVLEEKEAKLKRNDVT